MTSCILQEMYTSRHREIENDSIKESSSRNLTQTLQGRNRLILGKSYLRATPWEKPTTQGGVVLTVGRGSYTQPKRKSPRFEDQHAWSICLLDQGGDR